MMPDADLRPDVPALDRHPLVVEDPHAAEAAAHDAHVADIFPLRPVAVVVNEPGIEFLLLDRVRQRALGPAFCRIDPAKPQHVGLPQQDVNLHGPAHVRRLAVGIGESSAIVRCGWGRKQQEHRKHRKQVPGGMSV